MSERRRPQAPARPPAPARSRGAAPSTRTASTPAAPAPKVGASARPATVSAPTAKPRPAGPRPRASALLKPTRAGVATLPEHRPQPGSGTTATPWVKTAASAAARKVTTRMQERLHEKRSAERRLTVRRWAIRVAIASAVGIAVWLLMLSPVFAVDLDKVHATGHGTVVDPAEVDEVLAVYQGEPLATINAGHIASQLEELTGVREASVVRVWPAGLQVTLTASEPVAAIPQGDAFVLVDDRGEPVSEADAAPADIPVITIPVGGDNARILTGVLAVIDELPVEMRARVQGIEARTEDSIHFVLRDGPAVEWGSGERSALKAEVLQVLLESEEALAAEVIDVSAPTLPITRSE